MNADNKMRILVSHSGKQYVHRVIQGLLSNGYSIWFCTPIWLQKIPTWLNVLPAFIKRKVSSELKKRLFRFEGSIKILSSPMIAIRKEMNERWGGEDAFLAAQLTLEKQQDQFAAHHVYRSNFDMVVGYEISSMHTFQLARSKKIITVLDLAQIHYSDILEIAKRFPEMSYILKNPYLEEINTRKQAEYDSADFVLTLSSFARQSVINQGFSPSKVYEVNLGFDVNLFKPKTHYNVSKELSILICGTDMVRKGLGLLLQVLKVMEEKGNRIMLTIVGPEQEIRKVLNQYGQIMQTRVLGFLPHEDLVTLYQEADLFVFPSYLDSWAMTVLEAMACGTPVIVSENTGSKDAVNKGGGIIIPVGDAVFLENAITTFYNQRELLEQFGKKARQVAMAYTWDKYYEKLGIVMNEMKINQ